MTQAYQCNSENMDVFLSISNINSIINLDTVAKKMQVVDRKQRISKRWPYNTVTRHQGKNKLKVT